MKMKIRVELGGSAMSTYLSSIEYEEEYYRSITSTSLLIGLGVSRIIVPRDGRKNGRRQ
jgi:hypothetical protein